MFGNRAIGTSNSMTVATAQQTDKDLLAGLSKPLEKYSKKEASIYTVDSFDMNLTSIGTVQAQFGIGGRRVRLNISPLQGAGHMVGSGEKAFFKIESTSCIKEFSYTGADGETINVSKCDVKNTLRKLDFGTEISVRMDNGFTFDGKVCDINRTDRFQFFKLIEAMGDKLGVTVGKIDRGSYVEKAILRQGKPVTSMELKDLFDQRGIGATVQCAFSVNNLTGKTSLYDIGIPENRRA